MHCQKCGTEMADTATSCPSCGTAVQQPTQQNQRQAQSGGQPGAQPGGQPGAQPGQQVQATNSRNLLGSVSIIGGIVYGAVAFVTTFLVTAILVFTELEGEANNLGLYAGDNILALFGWFFYNAHTVSITSSTSSDAVNILETAYQSAGSAATVPKLAYYILPVSVLFLLGYVLADRASPSDATPIEGAVGGASIALGYGVIAFLAGSSVFTITEAGESAGPQTGSIIMMMGLLYPVVISGAAGYLSRA
jgi:hypothetical protein